MVTRMKTTIEISDPLITAAKEVASLEGTTLKELVEQGLRHVLSQHKAALPFRLKKASFKGKGLQPGVSDGAWEQIREIVYEGQGG